MLFHVPVEERPEEASAEPEVGFGKSATSSHEVGDALAQGVVDPFPFAGFSLAFVRSAQCLCRRRANN